jgi:hypothetical protein
MGGRMIAGLVPALNRQASRRRNTSLAQGGTTILTGRGDSRALPAGMLGQRTIFLQTLIIADKEAA